MTNVTDNLGNTETLFGGEIGLSMFGNTVIEAAAHLLNEKDYPEKLTVQNQWGNLYIELKYMPSQMLLSSATLGYAVDELKAALKEYLVERFTVKYPNQVGFIAYMEKNRFIVKAIISLVDSLEE